MSDLEQLATVSQASMTREAVYAVILGIIFNTGIFMAVLDTRMAGLRELVRKLDVQRELVSVAPSPGSSLLVRGRVGCSWGGGPQTHGESSEMAVMSVCVRRDRSRRRGAEGASCCSL